MEEWCCNCLSHPVAPGRPSKRCPALTPQSPGAFHSTCRALRSTVRCGEETRLLDPSDTKDVYKIMRTPDERDFMWQGSGRVDFLLLYYSVSNNRVFFEDFFGWDGKEGGRKGRFTIWLPHPQARELLLPVPIVRLAGDNL